MKKRLSSYYLNRIIGIKSVFLVMVILVLSNHSLLAQTTAEPAASKPAVEEKWYETFKIRGTCKFVTIDC